MQQHSFASSIADLVASLMTTRFTLEVEAKPFAVKQLGPLPVRLLCFCVTIQLYSTV